MLRKALLSIAVALFSLSLLVIGIAAQSDSAQTIGAQSVLRGSSAIRVQPNADAANVVQTVPVTVTLSIPGPYGPITVEVPIFLSLDIRIGISPELVTTLAVTPSVVAAVDATATTTATAESIIESTPESTAVVPTEVADAVETAVETVVATQTTTVANPTATALPEEAEPTQAPWPTFTPTVTATVVTAPVVVAPVCSDPRAGITTPGVNQVLSGRVNVIGTAAHENFQYYKVEYAQGADVDPNGSFAYLDDGRVQVIGSLLATFNSNNFSNGAYTIKLTVVDNSGNFPPPCTVSVVIRN
jgi:hypothetical protein